jgi:hypothetical protein
MKKIIVYATPVAPKTKIYVLDETGVVIDQLGIQQDDLAETLNLLVDKYDTNILALKGPQSYTEGIEKQIRKANITHYSNKELVFTYIS